jgi:hypothetical protein
MIFIINGIFAIFISEPFDFLFDLETLKRGEYKLRSKDNILYLEARGQEKQIDQKELTEED